MSNLMIDHDPHDRIADVRLCVIFSITSCLFLYLFWYSNLYSDFEPWGENGNNYSVSKKVSQVGGDQLAEKEVMIESSAINNAIRKSHFLPVVNNTSSI